MEKAIKRRKIWLTVGILTAISGVLAIPGVVITALRGIYWLMAICICFLAHAFYGVSFYFVAFAGAGETVRCINAERAGLRSFQDISSFTGLTLSATKDRILKCIKNGYITGYLLTDEGLEEIKVPREERKCSYCGTVIAPDSDECSSCGAKE